MKKGNLGVPLVRGSILQSWLVVMLIASSSTSMNKCLLKGVVVGSLLYRTQVFEAMKTFARFPFRAPHLQFFVEILYVNFLAFLVTLSACYILQTEL